MENEKPYISEIITDPEILKTKVDDNSYGTLIRIEKHGNAKHKSESRIFNREINESYCDEPACEFYNKRTSQGNCWDATDPEEKKFHHYIDYSEDSAESYLKELKEITKPEEYVEHLESSLVCNWMNYTFTLDECIRLRAENARLKLRLGEYK